MTYTILQYVFGGAALLLAGGSYFFKSRRGVMIWAAGSAAAAGLAAHYHVFWVTAVFAMMIPWALVCLGPWIDSAWRAKVGFCVYLGVAAALCLYPTYIDERFANPDVDKELTTEQQNEIDQRSRDGEFGWGRWLRANVPFRLVRGLDLKGGFRVEYAVDVQQAIKDKRDRYYDDIRTDLARKFNIVAEDAFPTVAQVEQLRERVKMGKPQSDPGKITVEFLNEDDAKVVDEGFLKRFIAELTRVQGSDKRIITFHIKKETEERVRDDAVAQAKDKVLRRVDTLGLKEAAVSIRGDDIIVEVPGDDVRQFEEIKAIIAQTARLEFKLPDDNADVLRDIAMQAQTQGCASCDEEGIEFARENAPGNTTVTWYGVLHRRSGEPMRAAKERFKAWVNANVEVPDTHQIVFEKRTHQVEETGEYEEDGWRTYYVFSKSEVTGDMIRDAQKSADSSPGGMGRWQVNLEFTPLGADNFERITGANIGKRFLIILDEEVESAPTIISKISGGGARITMGQGSNQDQLHNATKLELVLKSGALPAPIDWKGEQQVGPSLGVDAIVQGVKGGVFGALLVFLVMLIVYARAGAIAIVAVIFNLVLQVAVLAMFGASMTLPGIAGLSLTIGIAVDANVLINERIRDEIRAGKSPRQAVDIGYSRAFGAIVDGHVTTLISGLILFQYGSGPIKGFAVTLIVGMLVSLFTGVVCTRLIFDWVVRWRKVKQLSLG